jgi:cell fate regulator YaaT (PSP1 superfamily)
MTESVAGENGVNDNPKSDNELQHPPPAAATEEESSHDTSQPRRRSLLVRYGRMGYMGQFRHNERDIPPNIHHVVIKTDRGLELGEIVSPFYHHRGRFNRADDEVAAYCSKSGPDYPLNPNGKLVRFATEQDRNEQKHLDLNSRKEVEYCQSLIQEMGLPMRLVTAEHLFGGDRIIFYFMSDGRVDFRELVRRLAQEYQTRIEMRQVGARDEARLVADVETCGRECCCKNFLKILCPVNMRMAKQQKATLDPSKISGSCGRLKCCLRYEDEVYADLAKKLPRKGACVLIKEGVGTVMDIEVLAQRVKVALDDGRQVVVEVGQIQESNYRRSAPPPSVAEGPVAEPVNPEPAKQQAEDLVMESVAGEVSASAGNAGDGQAAARKRKRRRRRKKKTADNANGSGQNGSGNMSPPNDSGETNIPPQ